MITINGKTYTGNNIQVINNKVIIDGVDISNDIDAKEINITVQGNLGVLEVDHAKLVEIHGDINILNNGSGDVKCQNINGSVKSGSGNISSSSIGGNVQTGSGNVKSNIITGSVKTGSGNIKHSTV